MLACARHLTRRPGCIFAYSFTSFTCIATFQVRIKIYSSFINTNRLKFYVIPRFKTYREWDLDTVTKWEDQGVLVDLFGDAINSVLGT